MIEYFQTNLWLMWILVGIFFLILEQWLPHWWRFAELDWCHNSWHGL